MSEGELARAELAKAKRMCKDCNEKDYFKCKECWAYAIQNRKI
jgi:hypothetical protein